MDDGMLIGMAMIVVGSASPAMVSCPKMLTCFTPSVVSLSVTLPEDAPLVSAH